MHDLVTLRRRSLEARGRASPFLKSPILESCKTRNCVSVFTFLGIACHRKNPPGSLFSKGATAKGGCSDGFDAQILIISPVNNERLAGYESTSYFRKILYVGTSGRLRSGVVIVLASSSLLLHHDDDEPIIITDVLTCALKQAPNLRFPYIITCICHMSIKLASGLRTPEPFLLPHHSVPACRAKPTAVALRPTGIAAWAKQRIKTTIQRERISCGRNQKTRQQSF